MRAQHGHTDGKCPAGRLVRGRDSRWGCCQCSGGILARPDCRKRKQPTAVRRGGPDLRRDFAKGFGGLAGAVARASGNGPGTGWRACAFTRLGFAWRGPETPRGKHAAVSAKVPSHRLVTAFPHTNRDVMLLPRVRCSRRRAERAAARRRTSATCVPGPRGRWSRASAIRR